MSTEHDCGNCSMAECSIFVILRSPLVWPGGATTLAFLELRSPRTFQGGLVTLRSWYQNLGTKILVPTFWYQDFGTDLGTEILRSGPGC